jgi:hypothetical protein
MPKYLLSAHSADGQPRQPMTDDEIKEMTRRVGALEGEMNSAGALVFGGRLQQPQSAIVVRVSDGETLMTDGPFVETKEHLGGFYLVNVEDLDAAIAWASRTAECVHTAIEVREFQDQGRG